VKAIEWRKNAALQQTLSEPTLVISPKKLAAVLVFVVLGLTGAHVAVQYLKYFQGHDTLLGLSLQLDLGAESNIPTWYSSSALLLSAILLGVIGFANKRASNPHASHWLGLAAIFFYLSLDEAAIIHERTGSLIRATLENFGFFNGFLYYPWVVFGMICILIVALVYIRFLAALPVKSRYLFLIAGTLYIGGALGVEILGGRYDYLYGHNNFAYTMLVACEESFEMLGIVVLIYALLSHLGSSLSNLRIVVNSGISMQAPAIIVGIKKHKLPARTEALPVSNKSYLR
jgi:hypothetical protein